MRLRPDHCSQKPIVWVAELLERGIGVEGYFAKRVQQGIDR
jgi:hypothetical protein